MTADIQAPMSSEESDTLSPEVTEETVRGAQPWLPLLYAATGFCVAALVGLTDHALLGLRVGLEAPSPFYTALLVLVWSLGAFFGGKVAPKVPNPLYLHAWLSFGLSLVFLLPPLVYAQLATGALSTLAVASWLQLVFAGLPPAFLLGATLPCLVHVAGSKAVPAWTRPLMWTSLGAGAGYWWIYKYLIHGLGSDNTAYVTSFLLLGIGLLTMTLSKRGLEPLSTAPTPAVATPNEQESEDSAGLWLLGAGSFALGLSSVAWQRVFEVALEGGIYLSTATTSALWLSLSAGALLLTLRPLPQTPGVAAIVFAVWGAFFFASSLFIDRLAFWFSRFTQLLVDSAAAFAWVQVGLIGLVIVITLPGMLLAAALWDIATRARPNPLRQPSIAWALALVGLGWVLGYLSSWYLWMPLLGMKGLFQVCGALVGLLALAVAARLPGWSKIRLAIVVTAPLGLFLLLRALSPSLDLPAITIARSLPAPANWAAIRTQTGGLARPILSVDDTQGNVSVYATTSGLDLVTDGRGISPRTREPGSRLAAHVPLLLQGSPAAVALLGVGDGIGAAAALTHPLERLDIYEPSGASWEAARALASLNRNALADPRVKRLSPHHPPSSDTAYQVIIFPASSLQPQARTREPSDETYQRWLQLLAPNGIFVQEIDLEGQDLDSLRSLFASLGEELRELTLWQTQGTRVVLMGSRSPLRIEPNKFEQRLQRRAVLDDLQGVGLTHPQALLMLQIGTDHTLANWALGGRPSLHRRPSLPYLLPGLQYAGAVVLTPYEQDARLLPGASGDPRHALQQFMGQTGTPIQAEAFAEFSAYQQAQLPLNDTKGLSGRLLREWAQAHPKDTRALVADAHRLAEKGRISEALARLQLLAGTTVSYEVKLLKAKLLMTQVLAHHSWLTRFPPGLEEAIAAWSALTQDSRADRADAWRRLMLLHHVAGDTPKEYMAAQKALDTLDSKAELDTLERKIAILVAVGRTALQTGEIERAEGYALQALQLDPASVPAQELRQRVQARRPPAP